MTKQKRNFEILEKLLIRGKLKYPIYIQRKYSLAVLSTFATITVTGLLGCDTTS